MNPLDNVVWHALSGPQHGFADGSHGGLPGAQRFRPSVCPFGGVEHLDAESWSALGHMAGPGGVVVLFRDQITGAPAHWRKVYDARCHQLVASPPDAVAGAWQDGGSAVRVLGDDDVDQMLALTALTQPGPFLAETHQLGRYVGVFDGDRLVAMAGERMQVDGFTEVSAVCTHPDVTGRGFGALVTGAVVHGIVSTGTSAFLHVLDTNHRARALYERLGFSHRRVMEIQAFVVPG